MPPGRRVRARRAGSVFSVGSGRRGGVSCAELGGRASRGSHARRARCTLAHRNLGVPTMASLPRLRQVRGGRVYVHACKARAPASERMHRKDVSGPVWPGGGSLIRPRCHAGLCVHYVVDVFVYCTSVDGVCVYAGVASGTGQPGVHVRMSVWSMDGSGCIGVMHGGLLRAGARACAGLARSRTRTYFTSYSAVSAGPC